MVLASAIEPLRAARDLSGRQLFHGNCVPWTEMRLSVRHAPRSLLIFRYLEWERQTHLSLSQAME